MQLLNFVSLAIVVLALHCNARNLPVKVDLNHAGLFERQSVAVTTSSISSSVATSTVSSSAAAITAATSSASTVSVSSTKPAETPAPATGTGTNTIGSFQSVPVPTILTGSAAGGVGLVTTLPSIPIEQITSSASPHPTMTVPTVTPGTVPTDLPNNPPIPMIIKPMLSRYPTPDKIAPTNSQLVQNWIASIDWSQVPNIPVNNPGGCGNNTQAAANAGKSGSCWWTCGSCSDDADISTCPTHMDFGLSFDDGTAPYTPTLLNYLDSQKLKATFFLIGSRVLYNPEAAQYEYANGHQICAHTWSHFPLTTLTNEQIVAELGWSKQILGDLLGVVPTCMRHPYGDADSRTRAIARAMNLTVIQWTAAPVSGQANFDTNDWKISSGIDQASGVKSQAIFQQILESGKSLDTGFIALQHDLYQQSVELAYNYLLPAAISAGYKLRTIVDCQGKKLESSYTTYYKDVVPRNSSSSNGSSDSLPSSPRNSADGLKLSGTLLILMITLSLFLS